MYLKYTSLTLYFILLALTGFAQDDRGFNYQAVARDGSGNLLANTAVNLRFQVLEETPTGTIVYQETHAPTTNAFGLFNVGIGKGDIEVGTFEGVDWSASAHYLVVELNGSKIDTTLFQSVPYSKVATAMHLEDIMDVGGNPVVGEILKWDGNEWVPAADETDDGDSDPTNEIQSLSLSGNDLSLSDGNTVTLPSGSTYTAGAGIGLTGNVISNTGDLDATNELQTLSLSGSDLSLSNGNTVTLPSAPAYTAGTGISISGNVISNTGDTDPSNDVTIGSSAGGDLAGTYPNPDVVGIQGRDVSATAPSNGEVLKWNGAAWAPAADDDTDGDSNASNELQTLSLSGNSLAISNGNAVSIPTSPWSTTGNDIYYLAGDVGIGTSTPSYPLQVTQGDDVVFGNDLSMTGSKFFYNSTLGALRTGRTNVDITSPDSIGLYSFATGYEPVAEGDYSTALNFQTRAYGNLSFATGLRTYSDTYLQASFGRYNVRRNGSTGAWSSSDPILSVGNGTSNFSRNDAFTIIKSGRVGINDATPEYLVDVENDDLSTRSIYVDHNATSSSAGSQYGVFVDLDKSYATANSTFTYGLYADSRNDGGYAYGIYSFGTSLATNGSNAYGTRAVANNDNGTGSAYGVYASFFTSTATGPDYAGYFAGNVYTTGSYLPSDRGLKGNIQISGAVLPKLMQLPIKTYTYQRDTYPDMNLPKGLRTGFMAQDVAQLMPELVTKATQPAATPEELELGATQTEDVHFQAVDYTGMVPYLVKAIQEQQEQIEALKAEIEILKQN